MVQRPIERSASPIAWFVRGLSDAVERKRASASRARAVLILPSAVAASASTVGASFGFESSESNHATVLESFSWPAANTSVAATAVSASSGLARSSA